MIDLNKELMRVLTRPAGEHHRGSQRQDCEEHRAPGGGEGLLCRAQPEGADQGDQL